MKMTKTRNPALQVNTISSPSPAGFPQTLSATGKNKCRWLRPGRARHAEVSGDVSCLRIQSDGLGPLEASARPPPLARGGDGVPDDLRQLSPCQPRPCSLFSTALSMQKTKKSVAKRFKLTATGKLMRRTPGFRHLLAAKSTKQKRRASRDKQVAEGHAKPLKRCLPFGL